jgi:hypothetical protein
LATYPNTCKEAEAPGVLGAYIARIGGRGALLSHGEARRQLLENNLRLAV